MGAMVSEITSLTIVYSTVYSGADQRKHQSSASLAFVRGIHRPPVNSPHKGPVTRKVFPFDDVIMKIYVRQVSGCGVAKAAVTHVLQLVGDCLATKKQLQPMQPLCDQKRRLVGDNYPPKSATSRQSVGDSWAIDCQLIGNRLQLVGNWSATGRRWVGDWLSNKQFAV